MDEPVPLSDEDQAILELEGPTVAGHTCKVIRLEPPGVDFNRLFADVAARVGSVPEMRWKLDNTGEAPVWVTDEDFRLERHLVSRHDSEPVPGSDLAAVTAELFAERLDRAHPVWRINVLNLDDGGSALIWRIHHALADGTTAMRFGRELLWHEAAGGEADAGHRTAAGQTREADNARRRAHLLRLVEHEFVRSRDDSPFDGRIGATRSIAFATTSLTQLHNSAKTACGATLNDAVLSVVAGALRHWLGVHHEQHLGEVRVKVPVSLHHGDDDGNHDSFFMVPLPLNEPDPVLRLEEIRDQTGQRKAGHEAEELDALLNRIGHTSPRLRHYFSKFESNPRRFALNVSNVRGPGGKISVLDTPVQSLHSIAEIGERHALRVAVVSVGDQLCFGFCADPNLVTDLQVLAEGVEAEAERLVTAAESAGP